MASIFIYGRSPGRIYNKSNKRITVTACNSGPAWLNNKHTNTNSTPTQTHTNTPPPHPPTPPSQAPPPHPQVSPASHQTSSRTTSPTRNGPPFLPRRRSPRYWPANIPAGRRRRRSRSRRRRRSRSHHCHCRVLVFRRICIWGRRVWGGCRRCRRGRRRWLRLWRIRLCWADWGMRFGTLSPGILGMGMRLVVLGRSSRVSMRIR